MTSIDSPEFKNDAEKLTYLGTDTVRWAEALVERFDIKTDDIGEVYGWTANMLMAGKDESARQHGLDRDRLIQVFEFLPGLNAEYMADILIRDYPGTASADVVTEKEADRG